MNNAYLYRRVVQWDAETIDLLDRLGKDNPFFTAGFARAMQALGREIWIISSQGDEVLAGSALGFVCRQKLAAELEFVSIPMAARSSEFWRTVESLVGRERITDITVSSFASPEFELPPLPGEVSRRTRQEYLLPLEASELPGLLSSNHKRNAKKAEKAGITIRRSSEHPGWLEHHIALMEHSAERRVARGESVSMAGSMNDYRAYLQHGAAELFQAMRDTEVLSSVLVLKSPLSAYYHSAGTNPDGMSLGASHFLIHSISKHLQAEGFSQFNLGGAAEGSSLARFKQGFGPNVVVVPAAACHVGPAWKKYVRHAIRKLR